MSSILFLIPLLLSHRSVWGMIPDAKWACVLRTLQVRKIRLRRLYADSGCANVSVAPSCSRTNIYVKQPVLHSTHPLFLLRACLPVMRWARPPVESRGLSHTNWMMTVVRRKVQELLHQALQVCIVCCECVLRCVSCFFLAPNSVCTKCAAVSHIYITIITAALLQATTARKTLHTNSSNTQTMTRKRLHSTTQRKGNNNQSREGLIHHIW